MPEKQPASYVSPLFFHLLLDVMQILRRQRRDVARRLFLLALGFVQTFDIARRDFFGRLGVVNLKPLGLKLDAAVFTDRDVGR